MAHSLDCLHAAPSCRVPSTPADDLPNLRLLLLPAGPSGVRRLRALLAEQADQLEACEGGGA